MSPVLSTELNSFLFWKFKTDITSTLEQVLFRHNTFFTRMGGWRLEVAKMALYMTFPVALFHYFNQPQYFEEWVTKMKREIYPPENKSHREEIREAIKRIQEQQELKMLKALEESTSKT